MLELHDLSLQLNDFSLKNIDLKVEEGEYLVILGPTGTGKTVLLEMIAGLQKPETGHIYNKGEEITDLFPEEREIGMVYQDYMLFPHLDVRANIGYGLKVRGWEQFRIDNKVDEIAHLFRIEDLLTRQIENLSGGERQRIALARALITSPDILLLDEPLSALDPATREGFQEELKVIHDKLQTTTLHVTHDFVEAVALADRIAVMDQGQIVQVGTSEEIFKRPSSHFVAEFIGVKNIFSAQLKKSDGEFMAQLAEGLEIMVVNQARYSPGKMVNLSLRPEDIIISTEPFSSTARNCFQGQIEDVKDRISYLEITVDIGVKLVVNVTRYSYENLNLNPGKEIYVVFKASAVHLY